jgi:hypothetical protein
MKQQSHTSEEHKWAPPWKVIQILHIEVQQKFT